MNEAIEADFSSSGQDRKRTPLKDRRGEQRKPRVFITGGTGFLGRHLVPRLIDEGFRLHLLVRTPERLGGLPVQRLEVIRGDIEDFDAVCNGMDGCDYAVHAAGHFRFWGRPSVFFGANVAGTSNMLEAAIRTGVTKLIHISSIAVIGKPPRAGRIDERTPCNPRDAYQRSKFKAEQLVRRYVDQDGVPAVILRPGAYYGPYRRYGFNRLFIEDPLRGFRIQVSHGRHLTFPAFVPDVARAVCQALRYGRSGEVYNISGESVPQARINEIVSRYSDISPRRFNAPRSLMIALAALMEAWSFFARREPFYPINLCHYVFEDWDVSSDKARRELGFEPTPLADGLRETVDWYKLKLGF